MEKVRALLIASGLPKFLWREAVMHAVWLKNCTLTKALGGKTPYKALTGFIPGLAGLPVWGAQVWVHDTSTGKLGERAKAACWVGFNSQSKGHRVWWPDTRHVTVEQNLCFTSTPATVQFEDDGPELEEEGVKLSYVKLASTDPPEPSDATSESASESDAQDNALTELHMPPPPPKPELLDLLPAVRCAFASCRKRSATCWQEEEQIGCSRGASQSQRRMLPQLSLPSSLRRS